MMPLSHCLSAYFIIALLQSECEYKTGVKPGHQNEIGGQKEVICLSDWSGLCGPLLGSII